MAALVQTYPQQTQTVTLLHSRPNTSDMMTGSAQGHHGGNQQRTGQQGAYRGNTTGPIQPYAFTSTPSLSNNNQWQQQGRPLGQTTSSAGPSVTSQRSQSATGAGIGGQPTFAQVAASKASPERYRRPVARHTESSPSSVQQPISNPTMPSGSGMATVVHLYNPRAMAERSNGYQSRPQSAYGTLMQGASVDDMQIHQQRKEEEVRRFRRRSMHSIDFSGISTPITPQEFKTAEESRRLEAARAQAATTKPKQALTVPQVTSTAHSRSVSSGSATSSRSSTSRPSSANRNSSVSNPTGSPASTVSVSGEKAPDAHKTANIPPRTSSADVANRVINPSPLSKPAKMATEPSGDGAASPGKPPGSSHGSVADSPAAKHLAAINEKGGRGKTKTSRLRRAFSFGSAAELQAASNKNATQNAPTEANKLHKEPQEMDLYEQEQARIAQKQEEAGIGASIYSGTKLFSGSTDNLSISSTASSASIMLRKMGRGVKKGGRSLAGLFRPKSVYGQPIGDASPTEGSQAAVTMVTVEAERERVNVNADVHSQQSGGTGFPHLERNSIDTKIDMDGGVDTRKSIVGGEKERAEVLATIRKGILKTRSDSPTGSVRGQDAKSPAFELPPIPHVSDSPNSSQPSTPNDEVHQGHRRSGSVAIGSEDYFVSALRLRHDTKSAPTTPQGGVSKRNTTFSPRIVFYDTWPPGEYDRRCEISTCNRLTPMLAQQIKEELNTFKMEMEVHETSKIYTHFF